MEKLRLRKTGQVYLPIDIRKEINLELGDLINIILEDEKILLTKKDGYEYENKCVVSQKGTVHIPTEIRRLCNLESQTVFSVNLDKMKKQIYLIPEKVKQS